MHKDTVKILLIENDELQQMVIKQLLEQSTHTSFELEWVSDFEKALETIALNQHQVYLVDYFLDQGRLGTEVIRQALEAGCPAPMILLTASDTREIDLKAFEAGAADFLAKENLTLNLLERSIRYALEHQKELSELKKAELEIQEQSSILATTINSMGDGVIVADKEGQFCLFNPAAEKNLGLGITDSASEQWSETYGIFYPDGKTPFPFEELPLVHAIQGRATDQVDLFIRNPQIPQGVYVSVTGRPLKHDDGTLNGGVVVFQDITDRKFAEVALQDAFQTIKAQQEQVAQEMEQARNTQKVILPAQLPNIPGLQLASKYFTMDKIGGDFYNVFVLPGNKLGLMVADVTGHGIPAALLSFMISNVFNDVASQTLSPRLALEITNMALEEKLPEGKFATMFFVIYDLQSKKLTYACGGHPPAFVLRSSRQEIIPLDTDGIAIGMFPNGIVSFEEKEVQLLPGDKVLLYTDAIIEVTNEANQQLGFANFKTLLKQSCHLSIQELLDALYDHGFAYSKYQGFGDDITLIGLEILE